MSMRPFFALLVAAVLAAPAPALSQAEQRIAAIVNDEVISLRDLRQRIRLVLFSSGIDDTADARQRVAGQVLRRLIDERLQLQEANKRNITVSEDDIGRGVSNIEKRNGMQPGSLPSIFRRNGVSYEFAPRPDEERNRLVEAGGPPAGAENRYRRRRSRRDFRAAQGGRGRAHIPPRGNISFGQRSGRGTFDPRDRRASGGADSPEAPGSARSPASSRNPRRPRSAAISDGPRARSSIPRSRRRRTVFRRARWPARFAPCPGSGS